METKTWAELACLLVFALWLMGYVRVPSVSAASLDAPPGVSANDDFLFCLGRQACGLDSVCMFDIELDAESCALQSERRGAACANLTGHIMRVRNNLLYDFTAEWDLLGAHGNVSTAGHHVLHVPARGYRYFDTGSALASTVRLTIEDALVTTTVASWETRCGDRKACDYLFRSCLGLSYVENPRCLDYERYCSGFARGDDEVRQACIPSCIDAYYDDVYLDPYSSVDSDALVLYLSEREGNGTSFDACTNLLGEVGCGGHSAMIAVLAISLVLALGYIGMECVRRHRGARDSSFGFGMAESAY